MKKILIANIFGIGDILFTTPLAANLKRTGEDVSVDYLCNARTRPVVERVPGVGRIFVYEKDVFLDLWRKSRLSCLKAFFGLFFAIRRERYDAVFDFTLSREFGLFFMLAGIPRRIGLDYKKRGMFLTDRVKLTGFEARHVIEHYLDLLGSAGIAPEEQEMSLVPDNESLEWVSSFLREKGVDKEPIVAVVPGGGASWGGQASRKRWPAEGFARTSELLSDKGLTIAIIGDKTEAELCRNVAAKMKAPPAIIESAMTLKQYVAFLSRCALVLCNDGGPLHMAVALGARTVSVFGPVDEKVYGPYPASDAHRTVKAEEAVCRPCYNRFKLPECTNDNRCLTGIDPVAVADTCLGLLEKDREKNTRAGGA